jgi:hypothetical protein
MGQAVLHSEKRVDSSGKEYIETREEFKWDNCGCDTREFSCPQERPSYITCLLLVLPGIAWAILYVKGTGQCSRSGCCYLWLILIFVIMNFASPILFIVFISEGAYVAYLFLGITIFIYLFHIICYCCRRTDDSSENETRKKEGKDKKGKEAKKAQV